MIDFRLKFGLQVEHVDLPVFLKVALSIFLWGPLKGEPCNRRLARFSIFGFDGFVVIGSVCGYGLLRKSGGIFPPLPLPPTLQKAT